MLVYYDDKFHSITYAIDIRVIKKIMIIILKDMNKNHCMSKLRFYSAKPTYILKPIRAGDKEYKICFEPILDKKEIRKLLSVHDILNLQIISWNNSSIRPGYITNIKMVVKLGYIRTRQKNS